MDSLIVYYQKSDMKYMTYDYYTGEYKILNKIPTNKNSFPMSKKYETTADGLYYFAEDLVECSDKINESKILPFNYSVYSHKRKCKAGAIETLLMFKRLTPKCRYEDFENLTIDEITLQDECKVGLYYAENIELKDAYSYYFRMFYPYLLASDKFKFPTSEGEWIDFDKMTYTVNNIPYGFYNCEILCKNENFNKVFSYNKKCWYTHYDLQIALKLQKKCNVKIKLLGDAYIYDESTLSTGKQVFGRWYMYLSQLKTALPKNILIKILTSSIWGYLVQYNTFIIHEDKTTDYNLSLDIKNTEADYIIIDEQVKKDGVYYRLLEQGKRLQKYNFRLKAFITSYSRLFMCKALYQQLDHVKRVIVDGFVLDRPFADLKRYRDILKYEADKSGHIEIENVMSIKKL